MISNDEISNNVANNLLEGILIIDFDGTIQYSNTYALEILQMQEEDLVGRKFGEVFLDSAENDAFVQTVLDTVFSTKQNTRKGVVQYNCGGTVKQLHIVTSFYTDSQGKASGVIMVMTDFSELIELRDAIKAMEKISTLNRQLYTRNELLSKTFGMFLSDDVVNQMLETPDGPKPGGEKHNVTVMMSDLRGFTDLSERMKSDLLIDMLNDYLAKMMEIIQNRSGTVIEIMGDGILAIFGAPIPSDTHADDAAAAALEMQTAMERINRRNSRKGYPRLEMGIGLDTGEVLIGFIGSRTRMKYGVVGKHVNRCSRIESYTVGGQILISPDTKRHMKSPIEIKTEIAVMPKGVNQEVVLSQITGIGNPYNIHIKDGDDQLKDLKTPIPISFHKILDKHTSSRTYYGGIISVGYNSLVLETETKLELFDNLQLRAGGQLFGKVMEQMDGACYIQFTSVPPGYLGWIRVKCRNNLKVH